MITVPLISDPRQPHSWAFLSNWLNVHKREIRFPLRGCCETGLNILCDITNGVVEINVRDGFAKIWQRVAKAAEILHLDSLGALIEILSVQVFDWIYEA